MPNGCKRLHFRITFGSKAKCRLSKRAIVGEETFVDPQALFPKLIGISSNCLKQQALYQDLNQTSRLQKRIEKYCTSHKCTHHIGLNYTQEVLTGLVHGIKYVLLGAEQINLWLYFVSVNC